VEVPPCRSACIPLPSTQSNMTIAVDSKIKATADMLDLGTPQALIRIHCVLL